MTREHDASHDGLLQRWMLDGPQTLSEDERSAVDACATCAQARAELEAVRGHLERDAEHERDALVREAQALPGYPGEERAEGALRERMFPADDVAARRSRMRFGWSLAAAAALVLWLGLDFMLEQRGAELPGGLHLSGGGIEAQAPLGPIEDYASFSWSDPGLGGWYRLTLRDLERPEAAAIVVDELDELQWTPTKSERTALPDRLEWRVEAFDASGQPGAFGGGRAWRSSP